MGDKRAPLLANLPHRVRAQTTDFKANLRQWRADLRENPRLLWRTAAVRICFWLILGLCAFLLVRAVTTSLFPTGQARPEPPTPLATLYVACTNPDCYNSYTDRQPMSFDAWPLTCRKCGRQTVYRAKPCRICRRWYATPPGMPDECHFCVAREPEEPPEPPQPGPIDLDDREDGW